LIKTNVSTTIKTIFVNYLFLSARQIDHPKNYYTLNDKQIINDVCYKLYKVEEQPGK